jgi:Ni,Fe-hydrogenase III large subunit
LVDLARANSIVMDRFTGTGVLTTQQAHEIGVLGVVARASALEDDARVKHPFVQMPTTFHRVQRDTGDVLARFDVRCEEVDVSLRLLSDFVSREGPLTIDGPSAIVQRAGHGTGIVEGWRGAITHRVEFDSAGTLQRVKIVDPSFFAWPALPVALTDAIVPDFPLVNKSFNLSYAGNDL